MGRRGGEMKRVVEGASLVFIESLKRIISPSTSSGLGLEAVVAQTLKRAVLSATDLAGITTGTIVPHHNPLSSQSQSQSQSQSVVYFSDTDVDDIEQQQHQQQPVAIINSYQPPPIQLAQDCHAETSATADDRPSPPLIPPPPIVVNSDGNADIVSHSDTVSIPPPVASNISRSSTGRRQPRERRVPSTPLGRALGFAGLGAGLAWGTLQESARRVLYGTPQSTGKQSAASPFLSDQNAERLALALCRMRGAALKLGQMLSIQDESLVPAPILAALDIVRQGADVMPRSQLNDVLDSELGTDWRKRLKSFDYEPLAAASIGQVHRAVLKDGLEVAMKIQYPGVADSIDSDIENVRRLLDYTNLIPKGLFLDRAIKVAKEELSRECDYELEARNQKRFHELLSGTEGVYVPMVIDEISSKKVLTTELVSGIPIDKVAALSQEVRNYVGRKLLELTLKELFVLRFMQTDPNWSNFLYEESTNVINLIDFGAAREYSKDFVDDYLRMVLACANRDRESIIEMSTRLGFLTGNESEVMLDAHVQASFIVGLPFSTSTAYDFRASNITSSISHLGATMLKHRLTPPPDEAYSLHRKLSGAFLACIKLGVVVPCRDLLMEVHQQYRFSDDNEESLAYPVS